MARPELEQTKDNDAVMGLFFFIGLISCLALMILPIYLFAEHAFALMNENNPAGKVQLFFIEVTSFIISVLSLVGWMYVGQTLSRRKNVISEFLNYIKSNFSKWKRFVGDLLLYWLIIQLIIEFIKYISKIITT